MKIRSLEDEIKDYIYYISKLEDELKQRKELTNKLFKNYTDKVVEVLELGELVDDMWRNK